MRQNFPPCRHAIRTQFCSACRLLVPKPRDSPGRRTKAVHSEPQWISIESLHKNISKEGKDHQVTCDNNFNKRNEIIYHVAAPHSAPSGVLSTLPVLTFVVLWKICRGSHCLSLSQFSSPRSKFSAMEFRWFANIARAWKKKQTEKIYYYFKKTILCNATVNMVKDFYFVSFLLFAVCFPCCLHIAAALAAAFNFHSDYNVPAAAAAHIVLSMGHKCSATVDSDEKMCKKEFIAFSSGLAAMH